MTSELHLRVVTPDRTVLDRKVRQVSFMSIDGSYGILAHHAPLMTATMPGIVTFQNADGTKEQLLITADGIERLSSYPYEEHWL